MIEKAGEELEEAVVQAEGKEETRKRLGTAWWPTPPTSWVVFRFDDRP